MAVIVVSVTMVVSILAAFSLARMKFWGSGTLATGVFLTYLIPESLLFIPLFKIFAFIHDLTGIELINHWWVLVFLYPTLTVPFCHLDHDRLFRQHPEGAGRGGADRRRGLSADPDQDLHPGGAARDHRRDDLHASPFRGRISSIRSRSRPPPTSSSCRSASSPP